VVVPSRWWENSPLVIQEAFLHQRPVICSDIGGMAEKVDDGVDGLHFRAGDARSLARVLERAVTTPALWDSLRAGIPGVYDMQTHVASLRNMYREQLERRHPRSRELTT
jgi:glycosyltransferase involved in cell wall biosynthesis